jgi:hypothetical protein
MEYILLNDDLYRFLDEGWTDEVAIIPAGTIVINVTKREGRGYLMTIKDTGVQTITINPYNLVENTPTNLEILKEYMLKQAQYSKLEIELKDIFSKLVKFKNDI